MKKLVVRVLAVVAAACGLSAFGDAPITPAQREYLDCGVMAIVHWGPNTFMNREWGKGDDDVSTLFPENLGNTVNPLQWVQAMKAGGIKKVVLVAKHHDGFCLWPATEESNNNYSTAALPEGHTFRNYNLIEKVSEACKAEGLAFGVYLSPWDRHHSDWGHDDGKYTEYFHSQVKHVIDTYGPISEMWFDGATGDDGYYGGANENRHLPEGKTAKQYYRFDEIRDYLAQSNPNAVIFGGGASNSVCWVGNESGYVPEPKEHDYDWYRYEQGGWFGAPECDTPFGGDESAGKGKWFWHPNMAPKSLKQIVGNYFNSVGRGGVLNWGIAPNRDGLVPDSDVRRLKEFGDFLVAFNASDEFAEATAATEVASDHVTLTLTAPEAKVFNTVEFGENLDQGEKITRWRVEIRTDGESWTEVASGNRPHYRRIARLGAGVTDKSLAAATGVRITAWGEGLTEQSLERVHVRKAPVVTDDGSVEIGGTETEEWMKKDEEGYNVVNVNETGETTVDFPLTLTTYEVEIKLTNIVDKSTLTQRANQWPNFITINGADGKVLKLALNADSGTYGFFLTGSNMTPSRGGTRVGTVGGNGDVGTRGAWTTTDGEMTLVVKNDGTFVSVYQNGTLIVKTDKNVGNGGRATSMVVGQNFNLLGGGNVKSIRYRPYQAEPVVAEELISSSAYLWLDANDADSLTLGENSTVTGWKSRVGERTATVTAGRTAPTLVANGLWNMLPVVDFGAAGSGKDLTFARTTEIRTVFMVAAVANSANVFMLGDTTANSYNFHRGTGGQYFHGSHGTKFLNGTYCNGMRVESPQSTVPPTDFAVYTFQASSDAAANSIGQDRSEAARNGGKKVAELIVIPYVLTGDERQAVEQYLMEKWTALREVTATVSGETAFADLVWDVESPVFDARTAAVVKVADEATLDFGEAALPAFGKLRVVSEAGRRLTLKNLNALPMSALDLTAAAGEIVLDATAGYTPNAEWLAFLREYAAKPIVIAGAGERGINLQFGKPGVTFKAHLVFRGGTHDMFFQSEQSRRFAEGGTEANPNLCVQEGATLRLKGHDLSGWSGAADKSGVISVEKGGTLTLLQNGSNTFYYRQRLALDPGAVVSVSMSQYSGGNDAFRVHGGTGKETAQFYMPASESGSKAAEICAGTSYGGIRLAKDATKGFAIDVGENSTLKISTSISATTDGGTPEVKKYGTGTLLLTGNLGAFSSNGGILTVEEGALALDGNAKSSIKRLMLKAGTTLRPAGAVTVETAFTAADGFTLDAAGLLAAATGDTVDALTVPEDSAVTADQVTLANATGYKVVKERNVFRIVLAQVPVEPGPGATIAAATAAEALEKAVFRPAKEGQEAVVALRAVETATGSGQWTVTAEIDAEKMAEGQKIDDTLTAFATAGGLEAAIQTTDESSVIEIPIKSVTKGLYYSIVMSTATDFGEETSVEGMRMLANGFGDGKMYLQIPRKRRWMSESSSFFFKVSANLEDNLK